MYHVNVFKKYIGREPEVDVVHTSNKDDATIAVARVVHQDTDPELGEVPDLKVKLGDDLFENQHTVKLKDNTPIRCKPYPLPYAKTEELMKWTV